MNAGFSYYDILGVEPIATDAEIRSAYRAGMAKYHPDVNSAPNAQRLAQMFNEAYETLSDPKRRQEYDRVLSQGQAEIDPSATEPAEWHILTCDSCGRGDVGLRLAVFFRVWSIVVFTHRGPVAGVFCWKCRSRLAWQSALFSVLLGPWGFPWGIIYTIHALWVAVIGGSKPRQENAQLLRHQGMAFATAGKVNAAFTTLGAAQELEPLEPVAEILRDPMFRSAECFSTRKWLPGQTIALTIAAAPILALVTLFGTVPSTESDSRSSALKNSAATTGPSRASNLDNTTKQRLKTLMSTCRSEPSATNARAALDACGELLKSFHGFALAASGDIERQHWRLLEDLTLWHQGLAADASGDSAKARSLIDGSVADLNQLSHTGITPDVRNEAKKYYDCFVKNVCPK